MKTITACGLAATIMIVGVLIWTLWSAMLVLAWILIGLGLLWLVISLWRHLMPAVEHTVKTRMEVSSERHKQRMDLAALALQERVLSYAEYRGLNVELAGNGTIAASHPPVARATVPPAEPKDDSPQVDIPSQVRYEDIAYQIPAGHSCLGVSENGVEHCDFKDLMTMLISGGSSTGKSNTVAIKLHEAIQIGRNTKMLVIDPHKNKPDSLYNKIKAYEPRFLASVAQKDEEIIQALTWFKNEFERRMELSTQELAQLDDILLVCDEVYALVYHREDDRIKNLIKLVSGIAGYESRGYGMYAWFLTQKVTGLKWLRDAVMTTICHKMQTMSERVLASNDNRKVAQDMDNWTMRGRVVVFGLNLPVTITQMPLFVPQSQERNTGTLVNNMIAPEDVRNAFRTPTEPLHASVPPVPPAMQNFAPELEKISAEERERILELARNGTPRREMCKALGRGNGYYSVVRQVLDEEGF